MTPGIEETKDLGIFGWFYGFGLGFFERKAVFFNNNSHKINDKKVQKKDVASLGMNTSLRNKGKEENKRK